jgi:hypothetical protein
MLIYSLRDNRDRCCYVGISQGHEVRFVPPGMRKRWPTLQYVPLMYGVGAIDAKELVIALAQRLRCEYLLC